MNLREYLAGQQALVDAELDRLVPPEATQPETIHRAMCYSLFAGGKRIRPILCIEAARAAGDDGAGVVSAACALELIHTYSLIHDDLPAIDDDTLRRGRPTCHVAFGEDVAILAGDGLFAEAFHVLLTRQEGAPAALVAALREITAATGVQGMVGGQYMDVAGRARDDDDLRTLHLLKTGRLIEAAVVCGALLSGAGDAAPYRAFARELGLLFQIVDDILDESGDEAELGKSVGKDRLQAKVTYVSRFGMGEAGRMATATHARALERLGALPGDTGALVALTTYVRRRRT